MTGIMPRTPPPSMASKVRYLAPLGRVMRGLGSGNAVRQGRRHEARTSEKWQMWVAVRLGRRSSPFYEVSSADA